MFFSPSTNGFYAIEVHGKNIPKDAVDDSKWIITYEELLAGQSDGMRIESDSNGLPVLVSMESGIIDKT